MDRLEHIVKDSIETYRAFLELEKNKYDILLKDDYRKLNEVIQEEQVYNLKIRGIEQKKDTILKELGLQGMTLKDIANTYDNTDLLEAYEEFNCIINELKETHKLCKLVVDIRIRRVNNLIYKLNSSKNHNTLNIDNTGVNKTI